MASSGDATLPAFAIAGDAPGNAMQDNTKKPASRRNIFTVASKNGFLLRREGLSRMQMADGNRQRIGGVGRLGRVLQV